MNPAFQFSFPVHRLLFFNLFQYASTHQRNINLFCFCAMAKMLLAKRIVKEEALLQAFGLSTGSCGIANTLTTVR
jgi:hypothetical protein